MTDEWVPWEGSSSPDAWFNIRLGSGTMYHISTPRVAILDANDFELIEE
jgi:hypothetical protein